MEHAQPADKGSPEARPHDFDAVLAALEAQQAEIAALRAEVRTLRAEATTTAVAEDAVGATTAKIRSRRVSRAGLLKVGAVGAAGVAAAAFAQPRVALAQSTPFLGELMLFCGNFAPLGWALCNGQLLSIAQNTALFSLLGTTFGGNGQTTFALPDLRGRVPVHAGQGPGLTLYDLGQAGGTEQVTLLSNQMPLHNHNANCFSTPGDEQKSPAGALWAEESQRSTTVYATTGTVSTMGGQAIGTAGGSQPHPNIQPFTCLNFCIALQGEFPSRT
jgi:microcystin-dependent protein